LIIDCPGEKRLNRVHFTAKSARPRRYQPVEPVHVCVKKWPRRPYFDIIGNMKIDAAVKALAALAQDTRLSLYRLLVQRGLDGIAASQIADKLDVPMSTLSFHLKELAHAGLITARQDGRFIYYAPNVTSMNVLVEYLTENCCGGKACGILPSPVKARRRRSA
jgi:DNA-binding transcriptional ArsR family regulator